jgi:CRP-like cAMP-binding protein
MAIPCLACRHLRGVGFEAPASDDLEQIEGFRAGHQPFVRGAVIAGARAEPFLCTLYSGWAIEYAADARGGRRASQLWLPGDVLGLSSLFGAARGGEIVAVTDTTVCRFAPDRLPEMLAIPAMAERLLRIALWQNAAIAGRLDGIRRLPAAGRLARFLLTTYAALTRRRLAHDHRFRHPLQRQQIAELLGLTPLHLRRSAAMLEREGLAVIDRDQVRLLAPDRLRTLAGLEPETDALMPLL